MRIKKVIFDRETYDKYIDEVILWHSSIDLETETWSGGIWVKSGNDLLEDEILRGEEIPFDQYTVFGFLIQPDPENAKEVVEIDKWNIIKGGQRSIDKHTKKLRGATG